MSYIFTNNMISLRSLTWHISDNYSSSSNASFNDINGDAFTGYYYASYSSSNGFGARYMGSILGKDPVFYLSSDAAALSRDDCVLPDDAVAISYTTEITSEISGDSVTSRLYVYYTNDTDEDITINKILLVGKIANTGSYRVESYTSALLFEELLDEPIILVGGERFARSFEFILEVN